MFEQFIDEILMALAGVFMIVVTPFIIKLLRAGEAKAKQLSKSDYIDGWIGRVFDLAVEFANATNGTFVKQVREKGYLTEEEKVEAFNLTKKALTDVLADSIEEATAKGISDANTLIDNAIESAVEKLKR